LIVTIVFFSTYEVVSKTVAEHVDPAQLNFIRFLGGGLILFPPAVMDLRQRGTRLNMKDYIYCLFLGLLLVGISMILLQYGINLTRANLAAVIFSANPLFVALAAVFLLGEPLPRTKVLGLALGFVGVGLTFSGDDGMHGPYFSGVLCLVLSALIFGIYTVAGKKVALRIGSLTMNSLSFVLGSLTLIPFLLFRHIPLFNFDTTVWPQMVYLTVFVTGLAYYTYFLGLSMVDTSLGSMVFFIKPLLASLLAAVTLGEKVTLNLAVGTLLVLVSIYLVQCSVVRTNAGQSPIQDALPEPSIPSSKPK